MHAVPESNWSVPEHWFPLFLLLQDHFCGDWFSKPLLCVGKTFFWPLSDFLCVLMWRTRFLPPHFPVPCFLSVLWPCRFPANVPREMIHTFPQFHFAQRRDSLHGIQNCTVEGRHRVVSHSVHWHFLTVHDCEIVLPQKEILKIMCDPPYTMVLCLWWGALFSSKSFCWNLAPSKELWQSGCTHRWDYAARCTNVYILEEVLWWNYHMHLMLLL